MTSHIDRDTQKRVWLTVAIVVLCGVLFISLFAWKILQPRALTNRDLNTNGLFIYDTPREITHFSFVDQYGEPFTKDNLMGKWTLLFPGFTNCPDICPTTMARLAEMYAFLDDKPKRDIQIALMSVDPIRDTPERLGQYVEYFNPDFIGLSSNLRDLSLSAAQLNVAFSVINPETAGDVYNVDHSSNIVLINPRGNYAGFFRPPFEATQMKLTYQSVWITD